MAPNGTAASRLMREYQSIQKQGVPHIKVKPDEATMLTWHYVLHDLPKDTEYSGGVYYGKLVFPPEYPFAPPSIYMVTTNGRFVTNKRLCFSMSDYHPETWNPSWRIESILTGFLSFMLDPAEPRTAGSMRSTSDERKQLAMQSFTCNQKNKAFQALFPEFTDDAKYDPKAGFSLDGHRKDVIRGDEHKCGEDASRYIRFWPLLLMAVGVIATLQYGFGGGHP